MTISELATLMNATEADTTAFVRCLSVWTSKGYSIEHAIERHMEQMNRFANAAATEDMKTLAVEAMYS